jgi:hypothetical protein
MRELTSMYRNDGVIQVVTHFIIRNINISIWCWRQKGRGLHHCGRLCWQYMNPILVATGRFFLTAPRPSSGTLFKKNATRVFIITLSFVHNHKRRIPIEQLIYIVSLTCKSWFSYHCSTCFVHSMLIRPFFDYAFASDQLVVSDSLGCHGKHLRPDHTAPFAFEFQQKWVKHAIKSSGNACLISLMTMYYKDTWVYL